jgi:hypothetical protein
MIKIARINIIFPLLVFFVLSASVSADTIGPELPYRLVYASHNLTVDTEVQNLLDVMRRAQAAGYNGIVLADWHLQTLDKASEKYLKNVAIVKKAAIQLKLQLFPVVSAVNQAHGILFHDPNLAEGMPVRNAPFMVRKGQADLLADQAVHLRGGDFEQSQGNKVAGWENRDKPGQITAIDRSIKHGGLQSLRVNVAGKNAAKTVYDLLSQSVEVSPYRQYHLSAWIKTENLDTPDKIRHTVLSSSGQSLSLSEWEVKKNQEWVQYHTIFNSQNSRKIRLDFGITAGKDGKVWIDDVTFEEVGLLNVLRRAGCPLTVKGEDGYLYREGKDYDVVRDEKLNINGTFSPYHQPPAIKILPGSKIREGQVLKVSYYHAVTVGKGKLSVCLADEKVHALIKKDIEDIEQKMKPAGILLNYSDIRVAGWCESCRARNLSPGKMLADHVAKSIRIVHTVNPQLKILAWSDMFDPFQNAVDHYSLVNGPLTDSWEGLSPDTVIVNWNQTPRYTDSLKWFADKELSQIATVCVDAPSYATRKRAEGLKNIPNLIGYLYMTTGNHYEELEHVALQFRGR